jgi:hypothetical protein
MFSAGSLHAHILRWSNSGGLAYDLELRVFFRAQCGIPTFFASTRMPGCIFEPGRSR